MRLRNTADQDNDCQLVIVETDSSKPEFSSCMYNCPLCGTRYRCRTVTSDLESEQGLTQTLTRFPCGHTFVLAIDKKGNVRSHIVVSDVTVMIDKIDVDFLKRQERKLVDEHKRLVDERQDVDAYKVHEQIKAIRKEILLLERDEQ